VAYSTKNYTYNYDLIHLISGFAPVHYSTMFEDLIRIFGYARMSCSIPMPVVSYNSTYFSNFNLRAYAADPFYRLNGTVSYIL